MESTDCNISSMMLLHWRWLHIPQILVTSKLTIFRRVTPKYSSFSYYSFSELGVLRRSYLRHCTRYCPVPELGFSLSTYHFVIAIVRIVLSTQQSCPHSLIIAIRMRCEIQYSEPRAITKASFSLTLLTSRICFAMILQHGGCDFCCCTRRVVVGLHCQVIFKQFYCAVPVFRQY